MADAMAHVRKNVEFTYIFSDNKEKKIKGLVIAEDLQYITVKLSEPITDASGSLYEVGDERQFIKSCIEGEIKIID